MAARHLEIKQGIKRRGTNRDQLLAKAVTDMSSGITKSLKSVFLTCTGVLAHRTRGIRKRIRDRLDRQVGQKVESDQHRLAVPNQTLPYSEGYSTAAPASEIIERSTIPHLPTKAIPLEAPLPSNTSHPSTILQRPSLPRQHSYIIPLTPDNTIVPSHMIEVHPALMVAPTMVPGESSGINMQQQEEEVAKQAKYQGHADEYPASDYSSTSTHIPRDCLPVESKSPLSLARSG